MRKFYPNTLFLDNISYVCRMFNRTIVEELKRTMRCIEVF